jgi:hypothetical protein
VDEEVRGEGVTAVAKYATAPFPYFGGKRSIVDEVWQCLGRPLQYIEPFCGSASMLLAAPVPASLEVIGDQNFYIANFWRCIKYQPEATYVEQDYPVSHVDLDARHRWLTDPTRTQRLREQLADSEWPGDARIAGWWVWGQCAWIGSGWCDAKHVSNAGRGVQSQVPHVSDAGMGVQSQVPHVSDAGPGVLPYRGNAGVRDWFCTLAARLERVRVIHGDWTRTLNHHYGDTETAVFLDPPYLAYEKVYGHGGAVASEVAAWAREHGHLRVALCGLEGDYDMPGWEVMEWSRGKKTYNGGDTTDAERIWFSPACIRGGRQRLLFA